MTAMDRRAGNGESRRKVTKYGNPNLGLCGPDGENSVSVACVCCVWQGSERTEVARGGTIGDNWRDDYSPVEAASFLPGRR